MFQVRLARPAIFPIVLVGTLALALALAASHAVVAADFLARR